jgi:phosphate transport system substrate-binding protein
VTGNITAAGSTALQPLVTAVAANYDKACPGATVTVSGGGSGTGLSQVAAGSIQIGDSDVTAESKLSATDAAKLVDHAYVAQGWIEVTNPDVTGVTSLTTQQNIDIWTGKDTNWSQVGGPDLPIILVFRPASSGTRATFKKLVLGGATEATGGQTLTDDSTGTVTTAVGNTKGAVSVIGYAYFIDPTYASLHLNGVALDGVACTVPNMVNGTYKLQAIAHMYTNGTPAAGSLTEAFLQYMAGPEVQGTTIPSLGYMPAAK